MPVNLFYSSFSLLLSYSHYHKLDYVDFHLLLFVDVLKSNMKRNTAPFLEQNLDIIFWYIQFLVFVLLVFKLCVKLRIHCFV